MANKSGKSKSVAFYNQWWFWVIALAAVVGIVLAIQLPKMSKNNDKKADTTTTVTTTTGLAATSASTTQEVVTSPEHKVEGPTSPGVPGSAACMIVGGIEEVFKYATPESQKVETGIDEGIKWVSEKYTMPNGGKFYYYVQGNAAHEFYYAEFTVEGKDDQQLLWWVTQFPSDDNNYKEVGNFIKANEGKTIKKTFGDTTYELINSGEKNTLKFYVKNYDGKYLDK